MKNILLKTSLLAALCAASLCRPAAAEFGLEHLSAADVRAAAAASAPTADAAPAGGLVGVDLALAVPFTAVREAVTRTTAGGGSVSLIDPSAPLLARAGESLVVRNLRIVTGGITMEPVIMLQPYLESADLLAIHVQKVKLHAVMAPAPGASGPSEQIGLQDGSGEFDREQLMADMADAVSRSLLASLDEAIGKEKRPYKAADILAFRYDKQDWTLRVSVSAAFLGYYLPADLVGPVHLTGFAFDDGAINLRFSAAR